MPTLYDTVSGKVPGPIARAALVTEGGRVVNLSHTPTDGSGTPQQRRMVEVDRPGRVPLLVFDNYALGELSFTHTEAVTMLGPRDVDVALITYEDLATTGELVRLTGMSAVETRGWWTIDQLTWKIAQRSETQKMLAVECSWKLKRPTIQPRGIGKPPPPASKSRPAAPTATPKAPTGKAPATGTYTVKSGDTLWAIAVRLLGSGSRYPEIAKLNGISNPNLIRVGTVLKVPAR